MRAPALLAGVTAVALAIGGATRGWASVGDVLSVAVALASLIAVATKSAVSRGRLLAALRPSAPRAGPA